MAKKKTVAKKRGVPKIPIDWAEVDKYLVGGALGTQVAAALGIHSDTLYRRCQEEHGIVFTAYAAKKRQKGDLMLHAKQFQIAMGGNVTMLVWLGKQRMGQSDQPKGKDEFNGSLASLLDVMHLIKTSEDFAAIVDLAKKKSAKTIEV